jgi:sporulation protein YlmC with PRC-barrel domain
MDAAGVHLVALLATKEDEMSQSTYSREHELRGRQMPVYDDADDIPLERDVRRRYRTVPSSSYENDERDGQGYGTSSLGLVALALGAGALLTWFGTRGESQQRTGWAQSDSKRWRDVPRDETDELIASNKVEGTAVYDRNGDKIGTVHNFMVGKRSGRVAYAVINFGGFLGFGGGYHALPWNALDYDEKQGGYVVPMDKERLKDAPAYQAGADPFSNPAYGRQISEYWLVVQ